MSVVGFDFGNASCVIAVAQKGGIDVIMNEVSSRQTPTMAAFGEKERYLGEPASTQFLRNIKNTITDVKRILGRRFDEPEVQEELKSLAFKAVPLPDQSVGVEVMYAGERKVFSATAIAAMILQKLKQITEKATEKTCCDVVIGVPTWWTDRQRRAMLDASRVAGLNCLRLINEPTAAALSYGIYKTNLSETEPTYVMFYDMGYASTSATIVEFLKGKLRVVGTAYDRNLGGRNFDNALVDHFTAEFKEKYKIDIKSNQKALLRIQLACERLKKVLNTVPEAPINVDCVMNDIDVKGHMKKGDFEQLVQPLLERSLGPIKSVLAETGIPVEKLAAVEIIGGGTRLIPVQTKLQQFLGRDISKTLNFEEATARGCALQCAILSPVFKVRDFAVNDINLYPIRFSWRTPGADSMQVDTSKDFADVFTKNNAVPSSKMITFHRSEGVEIVAEYSDTSLLPPGTDTLVAKFVIPKLPTNKTEPVKIRAKVKLDLNSIVAVESAELVEKVEEEASASPAPEQKADSEATPMQAEPTTPSDNATPAPETKKEEEKKKQKVRKIDLAVEEQTTFIPTKDLQALAEEEAKMVASDRLAFETAEKKNAVESYIYEMRGKISESLSEFATETEKQNLASILDETENWLYGEGENVTKSVYVKKLDAMKVLGDPIAKRKNEYENRFDAVVGLRQNVEQFKSTATSADPKYEHITDEEKRKVIQECDNVAKWINDEMAKQDRLAKSVNPIITVQDITKKQAELQKFCQAILNKPKPKPEPKKEEPKKEEPKPEEKKAESKPAEAEKPKENEMDLD